jgi:hypothetical protein
MPLHGKPMMRITRAFRPKSLYVYQACPKMSLNYTLFTDHGMVSFYHPGEKFHPPAWADMGGEHR